MSKTINIAWLGIGGNLGDRASHIEKSISQLKEHGKIITIANTIETKAWGITDRPAYLNTVACIGTTLFPHELLAECQKIEKNIGRTKAIKWDSRIIDIDILYFNNWMFKSDILEVPHPYISERDFVLIPMAETAPNHVHPKLKLSQARLLEKLNE